MVELSEADAKLATLARAAMSRAGTPGAAAVRDETGRSYVAVPVRAGPLELSALALAVAMARSSGASVLPAAVLIGPPPAPADLEVLRAVGSQILHLIEPDGTLRETLTG